MPLPADAPLWTGVEKRRKRGAVFPRFSESVRGKGYLPPPRNFTADPAPVVSGQGLRRPAAGTPFHPEQNLPEFSQEITTPTDSPTEFILYILFIFSLFIAREREDSAGAQEGGYFLGSCALTLADRMDPHPP